ncbi:MAG: hypothetical protein EXR50_08570 [Dehalococcoidia bacterium]|nr:hypothetical protein [Dehalococcoidia bacterium]
MKKSFLIYIVILATLLFSGTKAVDAAGPEGFTVSKVVQSSADNGPRVNLTTINGSFATGNDRVLVYDRGADMGESSDWRKATDFVNDTWLFDAGADGTVQLAIVFGKEGDGLVAKLFDDQDGDGNVSYNVVSGSPVIKESDRPTVIIVAKDGWWTKAGKINYNLDIKVDGKLQATEDFDLDRYKHEGIIDAETHVRDYDGDGFPDLEWTKTFYPGSDRDNIIRSHIRGSETKRLPLEGYAFYPFLKASPRTSEIELYTRSMAPIQIDWGRGKIASTGEFISSRWGGNTWFIKAKAHMRGEQPYKLDFENPFGFYDFSGTNDGYPDVQVRLEYNPPNDPIFNAELGRRFPKPIETVRYSWDIDHNHTWDFGLNLIGRHEIDSVVEFPEFSIKSIPYKEIPNWVKERKWDVANLVIPENGYAWTSEGVYEGQWLQSRDDYVTGFSDTPPDGEVETTAGVGFRVEYNYQYQRQPMLYLSPIDNRIHLLGASDGHWKIDAQRRLEYEDLNGDGYIDQWRLWNSWNEADRGVEANETLTYSGDYLLYSGAGLAAFAPATLPTALYQAAPPGNSEEWASFGQALKKYGKEPLPNTSLMSVFGRLSLVPTVINGAGLSDVRMTQKGLSGWLVIEPGFSKSGALLASEGTTLAPGQYMFRGEIPLTIRKATGPSLSLNGGMQLSSNAPSEGEQVGLSASLANSGEKTASNVLVTFYSQFGTDDPQVLSRSFREIRGGSAVKEDTVWFPRQPGEWRIGVRTEYVDAESNEPRVMEIESTVNVLPWDNAGWLGFVDVSGSGKTVLIIASLGLVMLTSLAAGVVLLSTY